MNKLSPFHGGITPEASKVSPLAYREEPFIPSKIVLPIHQGKSQDVEVLVSEGDYVCKNQLLVKPKSIGSVAVHASTSGVVKSFAELPVIHLSGLDDQCIVIETDGLNRMNTHTGDNTQPKSMEHFIELLQLSGIVGLGGAGFPTQLKLTSQKIALPKTLIINGAECEPYISADDALMVNRVSSICDGVQLLKKYLNFERIILALEDNMQMALCSMRAAIEKIDGSVTTLPVVYPTGGERQLIQLLMNLEIGKKELPHQYGITCLNVATVAAIGDYFRYQEPCVSRIVTLAGSELKEPINQRVLIGTPINELMESVDVRTDSHVVVGGPLMGSSLSNTSASVMKTTNCLIFENKFSKARMQRDCINCGYCADACPVSLQPQTLYKYISSASLEKAGRHHVDECIECACCNYVCPSNLSLAQTFKFAKQELSYQFNQKQSAELSKQRYEAKQAREERVKAARKKKHILNLKTKAMEKEGCGKSTKSILHDVLKRKGHIKRDTSQE